MSISINTQLINSLAQVILSLKPEEQILLSQTVQKLKAAPSGVERPDLDLFFKELDTLVPDAEQPTLEEISAEVKLVRQAIWTEA
ncbi:MAG: hypothetical protein AAFV90_15190 [Cyanobacteria bacterium J06634_5]